MKKLCILAAMLSLQVSANIAEQAALETEAKAKIKAFGGQLKATLQNAVAQGGAENGLAVCHTAAPGIALSHSDEQWGIGRTSLKTRNPANKPDSWELTHLKQFEQQKRQGVPVSQLGFSEITVNPQGDRVFRLIKPIPTGELCLQCHGSDIAPGVQAKIKQLYPDDEAVNFKLGDIRGAFTVSKKYK